MDLLATEFKPTNNSSSSQTNTPRGSLVNSPINSPAIQTARWARCSDVEIPGIFEFYYPNNVNTNNDNATGHMLRTSCIDFGNIDKTEDDSKSLRTLLKEEKESDLSISMCLAVFRHEVRRDEEQGSANSREWPINVFNILFKVVSGNKTYYFGKTDPIAASYGGSTERKPFESVKDEGENFHGLLPIVSNHLVSGWDHTQSDRLCDLFYGEQDRKEMIEHPQPLGNAITGPMSNPPTLEPTPGVRGGNPRDVRNPEGKIRVKSRYFCIKGYNKSVLIDLAKHAGDDLSLSVEFGAIETKQNYFAPQFAPIIRLEYTKTGSLQSILSEFMNSKHRHSFGHEGNLAYQGDISKIKYGKRYTFGDSSIFITKNGVAPENNAASSSSSTGFNTANITTDLDFGQACPPFC